MKKLLSVALFLAFAGLASAQKTTTVKKPQPVPPVKMKNLNDSASYAIGVSVANFYKQQGITKLNTTLVSKAINDILGGKTAIMDDATANAVMNKCLSSLQEDKSKPNIDAGQKFLAQNKLRSGVKTTASGLQYEVMVEGTGERPTASDSVTCNYLGTLINGTEFDNSYKRGQPITFALRGVIPGWTEALQLMTPGSKYKLYIPYTLGYGAFDYGPIPGGSALIFEVELLQVRKGPLVQEGIKEKD
jgi:FKBP-type peptidyl-prolyl cis-trans isomerase FklB